MKLICVIFLSTLSMVAQAQGAKWSCAAACAKEAEILVNQDYKGLHYVTAQGGSAADTFNAMITLCGHSSYIFNSLVGAGGPVSIYRAPATLQNSCVKETD